MLPDRCSRLRHPLLARADKYKHRHHGRAYLDASVLHRTAAREMAPGGQNADVTEVASSIRFETHAPDSLDPTLPHYFARIMHHDERPGCTALYQARDFAGFRLFKINGLEAGFAIKPVENGGEVVAVHNLSGRKGMLRTLLAYARANGGNRLTHFDGELASFYVEYFPLIVHTEAWIDAYAPPGWERTRVEIGHSVHADRHARDDPADTLLTKVRENYAAGRPDLVHRRSSRTFEHAWQMP